MSYTKSERSTLIVFDNNTDNENCQSETRLPVARFSVFRSTLLKPQKYISTPRGIWCCIVCLYITMIFALDLILRVATNDFLLSVLLVPNIFYVGIILLSIFSKQYSAKTILVYLPQYGVLVLGVVLVGLGCWQHILIHWQGDAYQLSDAVNGNFARYGYRNLRQRIRYSIAYPYSIAQSFMVRTQCWHLKTMHEVVQKKSETLGAFEYNNSLVVHLRLGDVIDNNMTRWIAPVSYYEFAIKKMPKNITNIIIVGSNTHTTSKFRKQVHTPSEMYRKTIENIFLEHGYAVTHRSNQPVDDDVVFMSKAPFFLVGARGFSFLIAMLVESFGGVNVMKKDSFLSMDEWLDLSYM